MRLMVDSNVVLDYLCRREPHFQAARMLFLLGRLQEFELWFTSAQANDIFYTMTHGGKKSQAARAKASIAQLCECLHVCGIGEADFRAVLESSWEDLEDACVYWAAKRVRADAIITRNTKDFERSSIKVFDCDGLFAYLEQEKGLVYEEITLS